MIEEHSPYFHVSAGDPPVHLSYREVPARDPRGTRIKTNHFCSQRPSELWWAKNTK